MTDCQTCNSKLVTDGLQPGQRFRCANCEAIFLFGKTEKVPADKLAWRSLWLGLASILLIFFTGIPAIYYGVKSLLRMRFVKSKSSDRAAAVAGIATGGCFGLFFGFLALTILTIGLFAYLTHEEVEIAAEVQARCDQVFEFEAPEGFKPVKAETVLGIQSSFDFADDRDKIKRSARIHLRKIGSNLQTNKEQLIEALQSKSVNNGFGKVRSTELLKWQMFGEETDVRKTIFEPSTEKENVVRHDGEDYYVLETHQYFALVRKPEGFYGIVIVFEPENFNLSESDVKAIFENLKIAGQSSSGEIEPKIESKIESKSEEWVGSNSDAKSKSD